MHEEIRIVQKELDNILKKFKRCTRLMTINARSMITLSMVASVLSVMGFFTAAIALYACALIIGLLLIAFLARNFFLLYKHNKLMNQFKEFIKNNKTSKSLI